jgi:hypothetical protein
MQKLTLLAVLALTSPAVAIFGGEPVGSSKQVIAPPPAPAPEFFRPNEFDLGVFGTYATGFGSGENAGALRAWGGGLDLTYWFPWKYAGVRFQGTGVSISEGGGNRTQKADGQFVDDPYVTLVPGFTPVLVSGGNGGGSVAAGIITGDFMLRLPLDDFWPRVHLAPYVFAGFGGILLGSQGSRNTASETFTVTDAAGVSRQVTFTAQEVNSIRYKFGTDRVLGHFGGGLEFRFTPHIGLFSETGLDVVEGSSNNFIQVNFGLRYAF